MAWKYVFCHSFIGTLVAKALLNSAVACCCALSFGVIGDSAVAFDDEVICD